MIALVEPCLKSSSMSLKTIDPKTAQEILSKPPFVTIDGVHNVRDVGQITPSSVRAGYVYRSAEICGITETGE